MRGYDDTDKGEWLSCPDCGSKRVDTDKAGEYEPSILFTCRECGNENAYWL